MIEKLLRYIRIVLNPSAVESDRASLRAHIAEKERQLADLEDAVRALGSGHLKREANLQAHIQQREEQAEALRREIATSRDRNAGLQAHVQKKAEQLTVLKGEITALKKSNVKLQAHVQNQDKQMAALQGKGERRDMLIDALQGRLHDKNKQLDALGDKAGRLAAVSHQDPGRARFRADGNPSIPLNPLRLRVKNQIDAKVKQGVYSFERVACCICDSHDFECLSEKDRYGLYAPVVICPGCGLIQMNPRMSWDAYHQFYQTEYLRLHRGKDNTDGDYFDLEYIRGGDIYTYLARSLATPPRQARVLEVGCASGGILQFFKDAGSQVSGCDVNPDAVAFGRDHYDLDLKVGTVHDMSPTLKPDIVIYSHTLEHVLKPLEELEKTRALMGEDGILYIEVPGVKELHRAWQDDFLRSLEIGHVYYFTLTTLQNLLRKAGFHCLGGDESIHAVFQPCAEPHRGGAVENDYQAVMELLRTFEHTWRQTAASKEG